MRITWIIVISAMALHGCDNGNGRTAANVSAPVNRAPQATDHVGVVNPGVELNGTLGASDADGDLLSFSIDANPVSGTVALSGPGNQDFKYMPNGGFIGADSFSFTASDGQLTSNRATVSIIVNSRPVAVSASIATSDLASFSAIVTSTDADGDAVTYAVTVEPTKGVLTAFDVATGAYTYEPDSTEDGLDSFAFTAADGMQTSDEATIDIEIFGWDGPRQFGSTLDDVPNSDALIVDDDGSVVVAGATEGSIDGTENAGGRDYFLRKYDRRGMELWTRQFGDEFNNAIRSLWVDPQSDGFYAIGNESRASLHRFDGDGIELWRTYVDFSPAQTLLNAYWNNRDNNGDFFMLSWTGGSALIDSLITKLDGTDGSVLWQKALVSSDTDPANALISDSIQIQARGIDFDSSGRIIVTGSFVKVRGTARPCARCPFIAMFDSDGSDVWQREPDTFANCGRSGNGQFFRATVAADDSIYVTGMSEFSFADSSDAILSRFSSDGTQELWSYCDASGDENSQFFSPALLSNDGNILLYGSRQSAVDSITDIRESEKLHVLKFDPDGNILWERMIENTNAEAIPNILSAGNIAEDFQGVIYLSGSTDGELTSAANAGLLDVFIMRLRSDGTPE